MPELPEVEAVRRTLEPVMVRSRFDAVLLRRADLRIPFPKRFSARIVGQTVNALSRRAKYLLAELSSGDTLLMHLGMSGSFRVGVARPAHEPGTLAGLHDHVVFVMTSGAVVIFHDPRRFGLMDLLTPGELKDHRTLGALGPEPLSAEFDAAALARACAGKRVPLKVALLDQRVVAGLGNIYACEALHLAGLSPLRRASTIATASGLPRPAARRLTKAIQRVLRKAIDRVARDSDDSRFRVYDQEGRRCPRKGCHGRIKRRTQAGRSTFYCPLCQR